MGSSVTRVCGTVNTFEVIKPKVIQTQQNHENAKRLDGQIDEDKRSSKTDVNDTHQIVEIAGPRGPNVTWSDLICRDNEIVIEQFIPPLNTAYVGLYPPGRKSSIIQRFDSIGDEATEADDNDDVSSANIDDITSLESSENETPKDRDGKIVVEDIIKELLENAIKECMVEEKNKDNVMPETDQERKDEQNEFEENGTEQEENLEALVDNPCFDLVDQHLEPIEKANRKNGLFEMFPTPKVLQTAQEAWVASKAIPPEDDKGCPLPFPYVCSETVVNCGIEAVVSSLKAKSVKDHVNLKDVIGHIQTSCSDKEAIIRCVFSLVQVAQRPELEDLIGQYIDGWVDEDRLRVHTFNYICSSMNIPSATISGFHKQDVSGNLTTDSKVCLWSSVMVNGRWKYIDTTRRSVYQGESHLWKEYRPSFCTAWLVSPLCFIQTHLPQKRHWQQLSRPVSREEWSDMVLLTPHFFHYRMQLHSHDRYNISCDGDHVTVLFRYPERNQLLFEAKLLFQDRPAQISLPKNSSCTFVETRIAELSELIIRVVLPHAGEFTLALFGLDVSEKPYKCVHLCSYKLQCSKNVENVTYFPSIFHGRYQWGPGADTMKAGLSPVNCFDSSIVCESQSLHLKFKLADDCPSDDIVFMFKGGQKFDTDLQRFVFFWVTDNLAHFLIHSPGPGKHVFSICEKVKNTTISVCSYLIEFTSQTSDIALPSGFKDNQLGITNAGKDAGFNHLRWLTAFSTAPVTGEIALLPIFDHGQVANSFINLKLLGKDCMDMTVYTKCYLEEKQLSCTIMLPRIGTYLLSLYVETIEGYTACWHNAIIIAEVPCSSWAPFPSRNHDVQVDFCLHSPLSGIIPAKSEVPFSLKLGEAHDVAVVTSGGWFHLEKSISDPSTWKGHVNTGARGTEMRLCARFESGSGTFTPLCVYKVISGDEYESRSSQQNTMREKLLEKTKPKNC